MERQNQPIRPGLFIICEKQSDLVEASESLESYGIYNLKITFFGTIFALR